MSIHINARKEDIANIVIMPGDPKRATLVANMFLKNFKLASDTRGILAYTGYYKNKKVTVMASGMGNPSMGIYSYELFNEYNVDYIIRTGTCGAYSSSINLFDLILVEKSYSDSNYAKLLGYDTNNTSSSAVLNNVIRNAVPTDVNLIDGNVHCTDLFYNDNYEEYLNYNCLGVEMESFALFANALKFNRQATALLTVTDNLVTNDRLTSEEREKSTIKMFEIVFNAILNL